MNLLLKNILTFVILIILQVVVFDEFTLWHLASPYVFLFALLMLPLNLSFAVTILIAFFTGLTVDLLSSNELVGLHAFSCVLMMSLRNWWITLITSKITMKGTEENFLSNKPVSFHINYQFPLIFVHHLSFYLLEAFGMSNFLQTLLKTVSSSIYTLFFSVIFTILMYSPRRKR